MHLLLGYIDPGSGMIVLQLIIAGIIGVLVFFRNLWWKFLGIFTGRKDDQTPTDSAAKENPAKTEGRQSDPAPTDSAPGENPAKTEGRKADPTPTGSAPKENPSKTEELVKK